MSDASKHATPSESVFSHRVVLLPLLCLLLLSACATTTSLIASTSATATSTYASASTPTALPIDCPSPTQPAIQQGARLTLSPTSGPVGTQVHVDITGLQPGCHLWLGLQVQPCLCETSGTPFPAPRLNDEAIQWITVDATGAVHTTFCLCQTIPTYVVDSPYPHYNVTPLPANGNDHNTGSYSPRPNDYFFVTVAGPHIPNPPPLFAKFTVTA